MRTTERAPRITTNSGVEMPAPGLGAFRILTRRATDVAVAINVPDIGVRGGPNAEIVGSIHLTLSIGDAESLGRGAFATRRGHRRPCGGGPGEAACEGRSQ